MTAVLTFLKTVFGTITLIAIALLILFFLFKCEDNWCYVFNWQKVNAADSFEKCVLLGFPVSESYPRQCNAGDKPFTESLRPTGGEMIRVITPSYNGLVQSGFVITGEARGAWYSEGTFPIRLIDANGKEISTVHAQAKGEWATSSFVPFEALLMFAKVSTDTGTLIFEKDNPSGLPENDDSMTVPVRFNPYSTSNHTGRLEGSMTIGPVCPVEKVGSPCKPTPAMFAEKKVFVYQLDKKTLVTTMTPDANGKFGATLPEGDYWVDMTLQKIGGINGIPTLIHINGSLPSVLVISIDTGIR